MVKLTDDQKLQLDAFMRASDLPYEFFCDGVNEDFTYWIDFYVSRSDVESWLAHFKRHQRRHLISDIEILPGGDCILMTSGWFKIDPKGGF